MLPDPDPEAGHPAPPEPPAPAALPAAGQRHRRQLGRSLHRRDRRAGAVPGARYAPSSSTTRSTRAAGAGRPSAAWGAGVAYASKAFLCRAMARLAHEEGMAIDVSTGGELHVALAAGVPRARLVLHGNNKSEAELARALAVGVGRIVVDSFDEIDRLERLAPVAPSRRPQVLVRVTPGHRGPHPRVRHDRPGRLQVRVRPGVGRRGRGGGPPAAAGISGGAGRRARPHRVPDLRPRLLREGRSRPGRSSFHPSDSTSCASAAGSASPTSPASRRRRSPQWAATVRARCRRRRASIRACA